MHQGPAEKAGRLRLSIAARIRNLHQCFHGDEAIIRMGI